MSRCIEKGRCSSASIWAPPTSRSTPTRQPCAAWASFWWPRPMARRPRQSNRPMPPDMPRLAITPAELATLCIDLVPVRVICGREGCLPELFRSQYFCQREDHACFDLAEPIPGATTQALAQVAKERKVVVIAPIFERRAAGVYHNSAAVIDA